MTEFHASFEKTIMPSKHQEKRVERTNCGSQKSTCFCQKEKVGDRSVIFLNDCEFDESRSLLTIENIGESEVAVTKLKLI